MGCARVDTEGCNVQVGVLAGYGNKPVQCAFSPQVVATAAVRRVDYRIDAVTRFALVDLEAQSRPENVKPSVDFWLVCSVNLDQDVELLVLEGNVITVDGKFVYVLKT